MVAASLHEKIRDVVRQVPPGCVTTYGAVARRIGACTARQVGYAMAALPDGSDVPWHRVINSQGKISISGDDGIRQRRLLENEGIEFDSRDRISLLRYGWGRKN